jgi:hypothetical protein
MTESLTKEERIQLSTRWPPDTKLFLKLLRVHDANSESVALLQSAYTRCNADREELRAMWVHWMNTDITENDDMWADFSNKVYELVERTGP